MSSNICICVKMKCDSAQLSMLISIYENEILTGSAQLIFSIMSVNCIHVCIIYVNIYEKISSGVLEVSLSILTRHVLT